MAVPPTSPEAYHHRTRHGLDRYAAGPETLDWDSQPNPFRGFDPAPLTKLGFDFSLDHVPFDALTGTGRAPPAPLDRTNLSAMLRFSFGLAAWKAFGPDRWSLRCSPSSGALWRVHSITVGYGGALADNAESY